jgi:hypothetical protein
VVTLTATADPGNEFIGWTGCEAEPSPNKCEATMSKDREVSAEFESVEPKEPLSVLIEGAGSGKVTSSPAGIECEPICVEEFGKGVKVVLNAKADTGSEFVGWSIGDCEAETVSVSEGTCEVTIVGPTEVKAKFDVLHPLLTVVKEGNGTGTVISSPIGIDCGLTCAAKFDLNETVVLEAEAGEGAVFRGWQGCDAEPTEAECEVEMKEARKVEATFAALPRAVAKLPHPIAYTEATLRGEVDPVGLGTEYRFEYLTEEEYEEDGQSFENAQKTPMEVLAPVEGFVVVKAHLSGLEEGTAYRFRLLAKNAVGMAEDERSFETLQRRISQSCPNAAYRTALSANLPDCRAYELVTPAQTDGLIPGAAGGGGTPTGLFSNWLTVQRGEGAGERLSYFTGGTLPGFEGNGILDGYRAKREVGDHPAGGWQSALVSPSYAESVPGFKHSPAQHGVSPDQLYSFWEIDPEPETFPETLPEGSYLRTPAGFEVLGQGSLYTDLAARSRYVSQGGTHVIFVSKEHLEEEAAPQGTDAIYDRAAGEGSAEVISVKPDSSSFGPGEAATYLDATEDGSAVVFDVGGTLYLHREGKSAEIAAAPNTFAGISEDGRRVFYAAGKGNSAAPLFACDIEAGPCAGTGAVHAPTEITPAGIFAAVSPDGSHVLFSSTEILTGGEKNDDGEKAELGAHNLYAWDGTGTSFLAKLSIADFENSSFAEIAGMNLAAWTRAIRDEEQSSRGYAPTRSSADGSVFVFQSHASLTAYENEGVGEIYRYDPTAEAGGRLLCISCDASGAPPSKDALLEDLGAFATSTPLKSTTMIANLTEGGEKVFFQSFDRLLPEDANNVEDVYEWEAKGIGSCTRTRGCLTLVSSGQGETPSFLYAMSANGHDVFIQTKEKLVSADVAGSPSIYDVREGGGIPEPAAPLPCQGDACQPQGQEPPGLPISATAGAGEGSEGQPASRPCAKGKHRVKGRCVAVKHKHRKHHRRIRANQGGNR